MQMLMMGIVTSFRTDDMLWNAYMIDEDEESSASAFPRFIGFRHAGPYFWRMM